MKNSKKSSPSPKEQTNFRRCKLYALMLLAFPGIYAHGQNIYEWNGSVNNSVADESGNWTVTPNTDPDFYASTAVINSNSSATGESPSYLIESYSYGINTGFETVYNLQVGNTAGSNGSLDISKVDYDEFNSSQPLTLQQLYVGTNGGSGVVTIHDNDTYKNFYNANVVEINAGDSGFKLGDGVGSQGTINLLGSGKSTEMQGTQNATLRIDSWGQEDNLAIGSNGGIGTVNIDGGSFLANTSQNNLLIGSGAGSQGNINILGGGKLSAGVYSSSPDDEGFSAIIGNDGGQGSINISGRSSENDGISRAIFGQGVTLGRGAGSEGSIYVNQGAQLVTGEGQYWNNNTGDTGTSKVQLGVDGGTGRVTIDGEGSSWQVIGETYYSGGMMGEVGSLYVGNSGTGEVTLSNGGTLSIGQAEYEMIFEYDEETQISKNYTIQKDFVGGEGSLYLAQDADSTGIINIGAAAGQAAQGVGFLDVKDIQFGDGAGTIVLNHTDNTGDYVFDTQLISGNGQGTIRQLAGTTTLADQANYTGDLSVEGGKLIINGTQNINEGFVKGGVFEVNGTYTANNTQVTGGHFAVLGQAFGDIAVSNGGMLSGDGHTGDVVLNAGGILSPGQSLGEDLSTLTVDSATFNTGSIYLANSNPDQTSDLLYATSANGGSGTVAINGGNVNVAAGAGLWAEETKYTIITTDEGLTGKFDGTKTNLAFLSAALEYDQNNAYLYLNRNNVGLDEVGQTYNQKGTGSGISTLKPGNPVYDSVISIGTDEVSNVYDNLSGEIHGDINSALLFNSHYARDAVTDHLNTSIDTNKNLWIDTWGHAGQVNGDGNADKFTNNGAGFLVGSDMYSNGVTSIGVALGYEHNKLDIGGIRSSNADIDSLHAVTYAKTTVGEIDIQGGIAYTHSEIDSTRNISVTGLVGESNADYHADAVQVFAQVGHTFDLNNGTKVTPYAGVAHQHLRTGGFTESGSLASLHKDAQNAYQTSSVLGTKVQWELPNGKTSLYADLGWRHHYNNKAADVTLRFIGGDNYKIRGTTIDHDSALVGLGAQFELNERTNLKLRYSGEFSKGSNDNGLGLLWEMKF